MVIVTAIIGGNKPQPLRVKAYFFCILSKISTDGNLTSWYVENHTDGSSPRK